MMHGDAKAQGFKPVAFTDVILEDPFWAPRIRTNREATIPHVLEKLRETGRLHVLNLDWKPGMEPVPHIFWDSDIAKWLEAACYDLQIHPDPELAATVEEVAASVQRAQQPDGYLNTYFTVVQPGKRWTNLRDWHELYCAGHFVEAAVAHWSAAGSCSLLDALVRYVDLIGSLFGHEEGKRRGYPGHPELELALVKLYRATGDPAIWTWRITSWKRGGRSPTTSSRRQRSGGVRCASDGPRLLPSRLSGPSANRRGRPCGACDLFVQRACRPRGGNE